MNREGCPSCGQARTYPYLSYENQTKTEILCGRDTVQIRPSRVMQHNFDTLEKQLQNHGAVERNPYLLFVSACRVSCCPFSGWSSVYSWNE